VASVVAYVPDLMDRSKVQAVGGDTVRFVPSAAELAGAASDAGVRLVVVDLSRPGVLDVLPSLATAEVRIIGFGSHVDHDLLEAARAAGCNEVLPRSAFFRRLEELLGQDGAHA
jgi:2-keto-3-deoxy-6-phosphogluconate aldolase